MVKGGGAWRLDVLASPLTFEVSPRRRPARVLHSARLKAKAAIHRVPPEGERSAMSLHGQRWSSGGPVFQCRLARREFRFAMTAASGARFLRPARSKTKCGLVNRVPPGERSAAAYAWPQADQRGGPVAPIPVRRGNFG
jgi:hypothetical protein